MEVTIYSKPRCPMCDATKTYFERAGVRFVEIDVTQNDIAMDYVISLGFTSAPVVQAGDLVWAGLRPDMIAQVAELVLTKDSSPN
jgi:glutaredoxin-like protein NrdH